MTQVNDNINPNKGKHLTNEECVMIEVYKELGYSNRKSSRILERATKEKLFPADLIPSTSTLYHWIDCGIMKTKNIDLLEKVSRKQRNDSPKHRENR